MCKKSMTSTNQQQTEAPNDIPSNLNLCRRQQIALLGPDKFLSEFDKWVPLVKETQAHHQCALLEVLLPLGEICHQQDESGVMFHMLNAVVAEMAEPTLSARI